MAEWPNKGGGAGEPGPQGEPGERGPQGVQGVPGEKGDKGDKGDRGEQGLQGPKGDQGAAGAAGAAGEKGAQGEKGEAGAKGERGEKGEQGPAGSLPVAEAWHVVGAEGQPAFEKGWKNFTEPGFEPVEARFRKDELGDVVIEGFVASPGGSGVGRIIFVLPVGYRPAKLTPFPQAGNNTNGYRLDILPDGSVRFVASAIEFTTISCRFRPAP